MKSLAAGLALPLLVLALAAFSYRPPPPLPADAPPETFSAERALAALRAVIGEDSSPHPLGSPAHGAVRERLCAALHDLGLRPELQDTWRATGVNGTVTRLVNVLARFPGREDRAPLMLLAHYDSVPAGPGASDDGAGLGVMLEAARWLRDRGPLARPVWLLFSDGEEAGLLGARAFVDADPDRELALVINFEARGSRGPSLMFETYGGSAPILEGLRNSPRPITNSLARTIYELLPNDTDLTVFGEAGYAGANFAYLGGIAHYHTPLDDLAHLDRGSLQHHGEHALALLEVLGERTELLETEAAEPVFFDLFAGPIVALPLGAMPVLAVLAVILLLASFGWNLWKRDRRVAWGLAAWPLLALLCGALSWALGELWIAVGAHPPRIPFPASPLSGVLCLLFACLALLLLVAELFRAARPTGLWLGAWLWSAALGCVLAFTLPAASYLLVLPACGAALCARWPERTAPALFSLGLGCVLVGPSAWLLGDAMGYGPTSPLIAPIALQLGWLLPLAGAACSRGRRLGAALCGGLALVCGVWCAASAPYGPEHPQRLSLVWHQQERGARVWASSHGAPLPATLEAAASFGAAEDAYRWLLDARTARSVPVSGPALTAPELVDLVWSPSGAGRMLTGRLVAPPGASLLHVSWPRDAGVDRVTVRGLDLPSWWTDRGRAYGFLCPSLPAEGLDFALHLAHRGPLQLTLSSHAPGLPPAALPLLEARGPAAVGSQLGDRTVVTRELRLDGE